MILPKGDGMFPLENFQGQLHQKISYSPLDDWKRSGPFYLPNQKEFMHETYTGTSRPITEFWVWLQFHHTELSLWRQTLSKQPTANLVSVWHISDQSGSSRHDKIQNSASKLNNQLYQFLSKNQKAIPCILVCGRKLPAGRLSASDQTDSYRIWSFPDAPSLALFAFLFATLIFCI